MNIADSTAIRHYFCLFFLFLMIIGSSFFCFGENVPSKLNVAVIKHFPPQYSTSKTGEPEGFAIDVIREVALIANVEIQFLVKENWSEAFDSLRSGEADIIPNQGITERRKDWFAFTAPVETFPVRIFVRTASKDIHKLEDLSGRQVGVVKLNVGETLMTAKLNIALTTYDHIQDAFFDLLAGSLDAVIFPEPVLVLLARNAKLEDRIKAVGPPLIEIKRAISVRKDNRELLDILNNAVESFVGSPAYEKIYTKWYGEPQPLITVRKLAVLMILVIIMIVTGMAFWRYKSLQKAYGQLEVMVQDAVREIRTLSGLLPICSHCKKIRDDKGYWTQIESYIHEHSEAEFSHSICQECAKRYYPDMDLYDEDGT